MAEIGAAGAGVFPSIAVPVHEAPKRDNVETRRAVAETDETDAQTARQQARQQRHDDSQEAADDGRVDIKV